MRPGGEKSEVVILVSDIRGYTLLSSGMDTDDVVDLLNDYFSALTDAIFQHDGTIDKITGDAILAVFGCPEPDSMRHEKAVRAALAMQSAMAEVSESSHAWSASVTGVRSGLASTCRSSARNRREVMSSATSARTWANRRSSA